MADSMCGPSNALQNMQKHTATDRTLQQDRLVGRQLPSQGFRSSPGQNAGALDREFEAFQAGHAGFDGQTPFNPQFASPHHSQHSGSTPLHQQSPHFASPQNSQHSSQIASPHHSQQSSLSGWANDFQRLQLSDPHSLQQPQFNSPAHLRQYSGGPPQFNSPAHLTQGSNGQSFGNQYSPMAQGMGIGMGMGMQQYSGGMREQIGIVQQTQPEDVFDDAAFARAFDEAERASEEEARHEQAKDAETVKEEVQVQETEPTQQEVQTPAPTQELGQDIILAESAELFMSQDQFQDSSPIPSVILDHIPNQLPIGSDLIEDHRFSLQREHPDAISRTAGDLLNRVRDNTSDKFANSQFLSFMRQLRDKEVKIEGDNVVGVETEALS